MRHTIHFLRGLPASGKSTLALDMVRQAGVKRINKDLLREMLGGGAYSREKEMFVIACRDALVELALKHGFDVVLDDTNLNPAHLAAVKDMASAFMAGLDVIDMNTPVDECIRRDALRDKPVGADVIRRMAEADYLP